MGDKVLNNQEDQLMSKEEEYKDILKGLEENPGIADLMRIYSDYQKIIRSSNKYLQAMQTKFTLSTSNSSE